MKIREFSGMASDYNADVFSDVAFVDSSPWKPTRAAGFVALLTEAYPQMSLADVAAFALANGIPDWEFTTDTADSTLIPTSGSTVYFMEKFPLPSNWSDLFTRWKSGEAIGGIPEDMPVVAPTPAEVMTQSVITTAAAETAPAPVQTIETTAQVMPQNTAPNPVFVSTEAPGQTDLQKPGDKTVWIILAIIAAIIAAMSMKKGKRKKS